MELELPETSELQAFVRTAETGSISAAARELGVPRATVGRRIERLEERLSVRLLRRTTRQLKLTDAGSELFDRARLAVEAANAAAEAVRRPDDKPRGLLRVSMPPASSAMTSVVHAYMERYPDVQLELILSTAHEDLIARNIDVALRAGSQLPPGLTMRKLTTTAQIGVASPGYLEDAARLRSVADLAQHRCLVGYERGESPATHWPLRDGRRVRIKASLAANDAAFLREGAVRGHGVTLLPKILVQHDLDAGRLVPVLPRALGGASFVAVVYPERQLMKASARAFIDLVVERFGKQGAFC
jgi:DNA-binding transcriptional LysR family regulator